MKKQLVFLISLLLANYLFSQSYYNNPSAASGDNLFTYWQLKSKTTVADSGIIQSVATVFGANGAPNTIDSVFITVRHQNSSNLNDTIVIIATQVFNYEAPNENSRVWADTIITTQSLSPGGNWQGNNADYMLALPTDLFITYGYNIAISLEFYGSDVDTFAIKAGCINNGSGGNNSSTSSSSYIKMYPDLLDWTQTSNIGYGNPQGQNGWFEGRNMHISTHIKSGAPEHAQSNICIVTRDTTNQYWEIIFEKATHHLIDKYRVYAVYINYGYYNYPVMHDYESFSDYIVYGQPYGLTATAFRLHSLDSLNNDIYESPLHRPILLSVTNNNGLANLWFNAYGAGGDFTYNQMYIYRGSTPDNLMLYDSVAFIPNQSAYSYIDEEPGSIVNHHYEVIVIRPSPCMPTAGLPAEGNNGQPVKTSLTHYNCARSNRVHGTLIGVAEQAASNTISIYPNPAQNTLNINLGKTYANTNIQVLNALGQTVKSISQKNAQQLSIDIADLPSGLYFVKVDAGNATKTLKVFKQ